jgi:CheY-like chemotaxis protein
MGKKILLVEDNEHLRQLLASVLRFSGYQISEARSGSEAIEKAALAKPSLILLDVSLPDMNGIDVARAIKKNRVTTDVPIIACSAYSKEEEGEEVVRAGCVDYLQKPIPSAVIKAKIEKFILP